MELLVRIITGDRKGSEFTLSESVGECGPPTWFKENEALQFKVIAPQDYGELKLCLYDNEMEPTGVTENRDGEFVYTWSPRYRRGKYESLFFNYFGIAELCIQYEYQGEPQTRVIHFEPVEVFASKANANRVEEMFGYLASINSEMLYSILSATKHGACQGDGKESPTTTLEKLECAIEGLEEKLPKIYRRAITRLVPQQQLIAPTGEEALDDSSLGWLMDNLAVLEETDDSYGAHLLYEDDYFRANAIQIPVLRNDTDIYENQVIHGYLAILLREALALAHRFNEGFERQTHSYTVLPEGYDSFFVKMRRFKHHLMGRHIERCELMVERLKQLKKNLEAHLPVKHPVMLRPVFTLKAREHRDYRDLFVEIIEWMEKGDVDWSVHSNLLAIQSVPHLFECYCYIRVNEAVHQICTQGLHKDTQYDAIYQDDMGMQIRVLQEPSYWRPEHEKASNQFVNSEGWTIYHDRIVPRSQKGPNARRAPDIAIEMVKQTGESALILLDAKYTNKDIAFRHSLPECTMKYVHGIHNPNLGTNVVKSFSILYPNDRGGVMGFHGDGQHSIFGDSPVEPSLQCVGVKLGEDRYTDLLQDVIKQAMQLAGVEFRLVRLAAVGESVN